MSGEEFPKAPEMCSFTTPDPPEDQLITLLKQRTACLHS